jgi:hypothetical protein
MKALTVSLTNFFSYIFLSKEFDIKSKKITFAIFKIIGLYLGFKVLLGIILK